MSSGRQIPLALNDLTRESSKRYEGRKRHSKAWAWKEYPSTVKCVGVLELGVFLGEI